MSAVRRASNAASLAALAALRRAWRDCTRELSTPPTLGSPKPSRETPHAPPPGERGVPKSEPGSPRVEKQRRMGNVPFPSP
eukprot:5389468-Amphidinium_carterae.1